MIVCVPLLGLAAILLGGLALGRMAASGGTLGGRRVALLAMGLGAATTIGWAVGLDRFQSWYLNEMSERMEAAIATTINATAGGDIEATRLVYERGGAALEDEAISAFGLAIGGTWGSLVDVSMLRSTPQGDPLSPLMAATFEAEFERATLSGAATFVLQSRVGSMLHEPVLRALEITTPDGTALELSLRYDEPLASEQGSTP